MIYDALAAARARGRRVVLLTVVDVVGDAASRTGAKMVADAEGAVAGTLGCSEFDAAGVALAAEALERGAAIRRRLDFPGHGTERAVEVFAEVHEPQPALVVLGGTPVGRAVVALAAFVGRRAVLVAPGGDAAAPVARAGAGAVPLVEVVADDPGRYLLAAPPGAHDAVLLSDHDAGYVDEALRIALASDAAFVGMLGSRRHAPQAVERLRRAGVPEAHLARLRAPVGLDIGSRTPEEIGLAIVAEVLAVERGRGGGPLGLDWSRPS